MKNELKVANWESDDGFTLSPQITSESGLRRFSNACREKLHLLREKITSELTSRFGATVKLDMIRKAVNEADAIAESLPFPSLILPTLAEEKVLEVSRWQARQRLFESRSWMRAA